MKKIIIAFALLLKISTAFAQCGIDDFFLKIKAGMTKFEVLKIIGTSPLISKVDNEKVYWKKNGRDSIGESGLNAKFILHPCILGFENHFMLRFQNDKLWQIRLLIDFDPTDLKSCITNYNKIVEAFKSNKTLINAGATRIVEPRAVGNDIKYEQKEQNGEANTFYKNQKEWENAFKGKKFENITVEYYVQHEYKYNSENLKWEYGSEIKGYEIEIQYWNLHLITDTESK